MSPVLPPKTPSYEEFCKFLPHEREVLHLLSVLGAVSSRSQLLDEIQRAGINAVGNKQWVGAALGQALDRWRASQFVWNTEGDRLIIASPYLVDTCILHPDASVLARVLESSERGKRFGRSSAFIRAMCFQNEGPEAWGAAELGNHFYVDVDVDTWLNAALLGMSKELWCRLPKQAKALLFEYRLWPTLFTLNPFQEHEIECFEALIGVDDIFEDTLLALHRLHTGNTSHARSLLERFREKLPSNRSVQTFEILTAYHATEATLLLFEGEVEQARVLATQALTFSRGVSGKKPPSIRGPVAAWVALLLVTGSPEQARLGRELIASKTALKKSGLADCLQFLEAVLVTIEGGRKSFFTSPGPDLEGLMLVIFSLFAKQWGLEIFGSVVPEEISSALIRMAKNRHPVLSEELRQLTKSKAKSRLAELLRSKTEPWELLLAELERAAGSLETASDPNDGPSERIIWQISVSQGRQFSLAAVIQKRKGQGWSKGRQVGSAALLKLANDSSMNEADRLVASHLREYVERHRGYPRTSYQWDAKVCRALVGHKSLYSSNGQKLDAILTRPRVIVVQNERGLSLKFEPSQAIEEGYFLERSEGELRVFEISEQQARLGALLSNAASIPESQVDRGKKLLAALAGAFDVVGDALSFASEEVVELEVASALVLRLWRKSSGGMQFQLVVQPFGTDGPVFIPGEGAEVLLRNTEEGRVQVRRRLSDEAACLAQILEEAPFLQAWWDPGKVCRLAELEQCYELLCQVGQASIPVEVRWLEGERLNIVAQRDIAALRWSLSEAGQWFEARIEIEVAPDQRVALAELLALMNGQGRFVTLGDGQVVALSSELRERIERLSRLGSLKKNVLKIHPLALPSLDGVMAGAELKKGKQLVTERLSLIEEASRKIPRVPQTLQADLRDYQRDGFRWLSRLGAWNAGALLCDDMGLGKTMQLLAILLARAKEGPSLVVAPTSLAAHWHDELTRFAPSLRIHHLNEADREVLVNQLAPQDIVLTTYGVLQREAELLAKTEFAIVVLDEAQAIKNPTTQRAKAAFSLQAKQRIVSTGTPIENSLLELWSLMNFANPGLLGGQKFFSESFARPITERADRRAADTLREMVRPFILRRTKSQVLSELPEKTEIVLEVQPEKNERAIYETIRAEAAMNLEKKGKRTSSQDTGEALGQQRFQVLAALTRLRQAACHPALAGIKNAGTSAKHEAFYELVDELREGGHRALVFSQFVEHLSLLRKGLDERGVRYEYLDGQTPAKERQKRVANFQAGEGELFLISLRAGGSGLNLTAADYVIHMDPWWNPAVEDQASDRVHRIGQVRPVTIYKLVSKGTVEERIMELHGAKRETAERLLDGAETIKPLDMEFLRSLIHG